MSVLTERVCHPIAAIAGPNAPGDAGKRRRILPILSQAAGRLLRSDPYLTGRTLHSGNIFYKFRQYFSEEFHTVQRRFLQKSKKSLKFLKRHGLFPPAFMIARTHRFSSNSALTVSLHLCKAAVPDGVIIPRARLEISKGIGSENIKNFTGIPAPAGTPPHPDRCR